MHNLYQLLVLALCKQSNNDVDVYPFDGDIYSYIKLFIILLIYMLMYASPSKLCVSISVESWPIIVRKCAVETIDTCIAAQCTPYL